MQARQVLAVVTVLAVGGTAAIAQDRARALNEAKGQHERAMRALRKGELETAAKNFRKATKTLPAFPAAHVGLGQLAIASSGRRWSGSPRRHLRAVASWWSTKTRTRPPTSSLRKAN